MDYDLMRTMTTARHKFYGDLYKAVRRQVGSENVLEYYFAKKIFVSAGLDTSNRMSLRCDEPLAIGFLIKEIKDANNNLILADTIWQISSIQPILNAFGSIESYVMKAVKFQGTL